MTHRSDYPPDQQRVTAAHGLFDLDTGLSYFTHLDAVEAGRAAYGDIACLRELHGWTPHVSEMFAPHQPTDACRPTLLTADLRGDHYPADCCCLSDLYYRGACVGGTPEGPIRDRKKPAAEDAHDHAWPGRRELPIVPARLAPDRSAKQWAALARCVDQVNDFDPAGSLLAGAAIRTRRGRFGTRHMAGHAGLGCNLCGAIESDPDRGRGGAS